MLFTPKGYTHSHTLNLQLNGESIDFVNEHKFLGMWIDHHLEWTPHLSKLLLKLNQLKFLFRKLNYILPKHCLRNMYFAFVHSRLTYGLLIWGTMCKKEIFDKLFKLQKSFIRLVNRVHLFAESSPLFLLSKILKLEDCLELELIKQMYHYKNKTLPTLIHNLYLPKQHSYNTRNNANPTVVKHSSKIYNSSFLCKSVVIWERKYLRYREISTLQNLVKKFKYEKFSTY